VANKAIVAPSEFTHVLAQILKALAAEKSAALPGDLRLAFESVQPSDQARAIARSLASGELAAVLLGNFAQQHPQAVQIAMLAEQIAGLCGAKFGYLGEAANSVGAYLAGALPDAQGLHAAQMLAEPRKAYILLNAEPELDMHDPQQAMAAMAAADMVVAMSPYRHHAADYADVLLPVAPFTETSGTFVSTEGRVQSFRGAVRPLGDARPAWKVLRVLGNLLNLAGFDYESGEQVRDEVLSNQGGETGVAGKLDNHISGVAPQAPSASAGPGLQRISDVPIYSADALVRRAPSLQMTRDAAAPGVRMHNSELRRLGVRAGDAVSVHQGDASARLTVQPDDSLPAMTARVAAGHPDTAGLGAMFGMIRVEPAAGERA